MIDCFCFTVSVASRGAYALFHSFCSESRRIRFASRLQPPVFCVVRCRSVVGIGVDAMRADAWPIVRQYEQQRAYAFGWHWGLQKVEVNYKVMSFFARHDFRCVLDVWIFVSSHCLYHMGPQTGQEAHSLDCMASVERGRVLIWEQEFG